jgi:glycine cleavage system aminomethyltransferase T
MPRIGKCGIVDLKHLILQTIERGQDKQSTYILRTSYTGQGGINIHVSTVQEQIESLRESVIFYEIHSYSRRKVGSKLSDLLIPFN